MKSIQIEKSKISNHLVVLLGGSRDGSTVKGLLNENTTLGTKRRLQKISQLLLNLWNEYNTDIQEVNNIEDEELKTKELNVLNSEMVTLEYDPISFVFLENIQSESIYDNEVIENITE